MQGPNGMRRKREPVDENQRADAGGRAVRCEA
jgi:hypothetical protein